MAVTIEVTPLLDKRPIAFDAIEMRHRECGLATIKASRNPISNERQLRCACGLALQFSDGSPAMIEITRTAIDEASRPLPDGSFSCGEQGAVFLVAAHA